jgi:crotonobetainyl-CoA:carnitine CoA-transferase CaiB-like acyl-CoA transferase
MNPSPSLPLRGIRILDLTCVLMDLYASQSMGDLGADVIKIASLQGDATRQIGPGLHPGTLA